MGKNNDEGGLLTEVTLISLSPIIRREKIDEAISVDALLGDV
jgi:hypothetical protein